MKFEGCKSSSFSDMLEQLSLRKIIIRIVPKVEKQLEGYSCKQLLKDPDLTLTLTLKVNIL